VTDSAAKGVGADAPTPNLVIRNLSKTFSGVRVLDQVSLDVQFGEVHGLLGQNGSGKSTLIKILGGTYSPDPDGHVTLGGTVVPLPIPPGAFNRYGIAIVHQALGLVPTLSVTENLLVRSLVREANPLINWRKARRDAVALLASYGVDIDPSATVESLAPVERALVAIVRAFREVEESAPSGGGLLILDEPTPFLSRADVERLFALVRQATARKTSVLFVSHDIDEVMEIADRATILRNGRVATTLVTSEATRSDFIEAIVGSAHEAVPPAPRKLEGEAAVAVSNLSGNGIDDFSLELHKGEIVGLTGLIGSGYDRVLYLLYGAVPATSGTLTLNEERVAIPRLNPGRAIDLGLVLVPADRQKAAVSETLTVLENLTLPVLGKSPSAWFLKGSRLQSTAKALVREFDVRPPDVSKVVRFLSGGNQQKVVLAKWFQVAPRLILLDEPTQGVDVGAREHIFEIIRTAAKTNNSCVLCASSDHEQLASICDRVIVFDRGRAVASLAGQEVTKQAISQRCFGDRPDITFRPEKASHV
jgi:ribose transport system ATP-binding protein